MTVSPAPVIMWNWVFISSEEDENVLCDGWKSNRKSSSRNTERLSEGRLISSFIQLNKLRANRLARSLPSPWQPIYLSPECLCVCAAGCPAADVQTQAQSEPTRYYEADKRRRVLISDRCLYVQELLSAGSDLFCKVTRPTWETLM